MIRTFSFALILGIALVSSPSSRSQGKMIVLWAPPAIDLPDEHPESSVPREMIGRLRVGPTPIILNNTSRAAAAKALGAAVGEQGDAGDWEAWLCFHGRNSNGRWMLWLLSSEVDNENVSGLQWMQLSPSQIPDRRCKQIPGDKPIELPVALWPESGARRVLGKPTLVSGNLLEYSHEHNETINQLDFTVTNDVNMVLERGKVRSIQVWRSSIN